MSRAVRAFAGPPLRPHLALRPDLPRPTTPTSPRAPSGSSPAHHSDLTSPVVRTSPPAAHGPCSASDPDLGSRAAQSWAGHKIVVHKGFLLDFRTRVR